MIEHNSEVYNHPYISFFIVHVYVIVISRLGGMYPVYRHEHEGGKRPSASDCKPDTSRLGVIKLAYLMLITVATSYCSTVATESPW